MNEQAQTTTFQPPPHNPYDLDAVLTPPRARRRPIGALLGIVTSVVATTVGIAWLDDSGNERAHRPERQPVVDIAPAASVSLMPQAIVDPQVAQLSALERELAQLRQDIAALAKSPPHGAAPITRQTLPPLPQPRRTGSVVAAPTAAETVQGPESELQADNEMQFDLTFNALLERELARTWDVSSEDVAAALDAEPSSKGPLTFAGVANDGEATLVYTFGPKLLDRVSLAPARDDTEVVLSGVLGPAYLKDDVKTWFTGTATVTLAGQKVTITRDKLETIPLIPEGL